MAEPMSDLRYAVLGLCIHSSRKARRTLAGADPEAQLDAFGARLAKMLTGAPSDRAEVTAEVRGLASDGLIRIEERPDPEGPMHDAILVFRPTPSGLEAWRLKHERRRKEAANQAFQYAEYREMKHHNVVTRRMAFWAFVLSIISFVVAALT